MQSSGLSSDDCQTSVIMRHKEPKNKEPSTPDLLNNSANVKTTVEKNRPRSCVNPTAAIGYDLCPNNSRIEIDTNRRWSGVQLGSKLMQAFDRLVFDESDDYTDSLENNKPTSKTTGNDAKVTRRALFVELHDTLCYVEDDLLWFLFVHFVVELQFILLSGNALLFNILFSLLFFLFYSN